MTETTATYDADRLALMAAYAALEYAAGEVLYPGDSAALLLLRWALGLVQSAKTDKRADLDYVQLHYQERRTLYVQTRARLDIGIGLYRNGAPLSRAAHEADCDKDALREYAAALGVLRADDAGGAG